MPVPWRPMLPAVAALLGLRCGAGKRLDFGHVAYSNLGGRGPDVDALHGIRYIDVGLVNGSRVDMIVVVQGGEESYVPQDPAQNGVSSGYGVVSVKAGSHADLTFKLFRPDTAELVILDEFFFTVRNIRGISADQRGQVTVGEFAQGCLANATELKQQWQGKKLMSLTSTNSSTKGPRDLDTSPKFAATFQFRNVSTFSARFEVTGPETEGGHNFLFSGEPLEECLKPAVGTSAGGGSPTAPQQDSTFDFDWSDATGASPAADEKPVSRPTRNSTTTTATTTAKLVEVPKYEAIKDGGHPADPKCTKQYVELTGTESASPDACAIATADMGFSVFSYYAHSRRPMCLVYGKLAGPCPDGAWESSEAETTYMLVPESAGAAVTTTKPEEESETAGAAAAISKPKAETSLTKTSTSITETGTTRTKLSTSATDTKTSTSVTETDVSNTKTSRTFSDTKTSRTRTITITTTSSFTATLTKTTESGTSTTETITSTSTSTSVTSTTTEPFDCFDARAWRWKEDQRSWCCKHHNLGCPVEKVIDWTDKAVEDCSGTEKQWIVCSGIPECNVCQPRDCTFSPWSDWSVLHGCVGLCSRRRAINETNNECGAPCAGPRVETSAKEGCLPKSCTVKDLDCKWGAWSDWSDCTGGERDVKQSYRSRDIKQQPVGDGKQCAGPWNATRPCGEQKQANCVLSDWGEWTTCSATCGGGWKAQMRRISQPAKGGGEACSGVLRHAHPCNEEPCGEEEACEFDEWESWVGCNPTSPRQKYRGREVLSSPQDGLNCSQSTREVAACGQAAAKPAPCELTAWADWSDCSATCEGQRFRRRSIDESSQSSDCFLETSDSVEETAPCGASSCDSGDDCELDEWSEWSGCSQPCGVGVATRSREVTKPSSKQGLGCTGALEEVKACMEKECLAVDCEWGDWEGWSACSRTCGGGNMRRTRVIETSPENGGNPCQPEDKNEVAPCATQSCENCVDGTWGDWEAWSECSTTCGGGLRARHREVARRPNSCGKPAVGVEDDYDVCSAKPCEPKRDCELSDWTDWSSCSSDCFGVREKTRHVVQYATGGGAACVSEALKVLSPCRPGPDEDAPASCVEHPVAPCQMGPWDEWGSCSASCDGGQKRRERLVQHPSQNGGAPCDDATAETAPCDTTSCDEGDSKDCRWGDWSEWSDCAQCGGQRYRRRDVARQAKEGGKLCEAGGTKEVEPCSSVCEQRYYCAWSDWAALGGCTADCGHASEMRQRQLVLMKKEPKDSNVLFEGSYDMSCAGSQINVSMCPYVECDPECEPQDCLFGDWSNWTEPACTQLCERSRRIEKMDSCGGKVCKGPLVETKRCGKPCVETKDCEMSDWSAWEPPKCREQGEQRYRTREILQMPTELGKPCVGSINETVFCIVPPPSAVDCALSDWLSWSDCSRTCDGGFRRRARAIKNSSASGGKPCQGDMEQLESCGSDPCVHEAQPCLMGAWSEWGRCSSSGMRTRQRSITQSADDSGTQCAGPTKEAQHCLEAVDCVVSDWTAWDKCDESCGGGQQQRQREVVQNPRRGGARCVADLVETRGCNNDPCEDVASSVGEWSDWGECDADCGSGSRERRRAIEPKAASVDFNGELAQAGACPATNSSGCEMPEDCRWDDWTDWTECSLPCDGGQRERSRKIAQVPKLGGKPCEARNKEQVEPCNLRRCDNGECVDGEWAEWQDWTSCSATCKGGFSFRSRETAREASHCGSPAVGASVQHRECNEYVECTPSQDCEFGDWSKWSDCTAPCAGVKRRTRGFAQQGRGDGEFCSGPLQQTAPCASPGADCRKEQTVDCQLGDWQDWTACDASCGAGQKTRSRDILQEVSGGGKGCEDDVTETALCQAARCKSSCNATDCRWSDWDDWSACVKCGGQKRRRRHIAQHPLCGGLACDAGDSEEVGECPRECHGSKFCAWGDWSNFTECSATCGNAVKSRQRHLEERAHSLSHSARGLGRHGAEKPMSLELQAKFDALHKRAQGLGGRRRMELVAAWSSGMLGLAALLATGAALRSRWSRGANSRRPMYRGLLGEHPEGYQAAAQMTPPSSPTTTALLPARG